MIWLKRILPLLVIGIGWQLYTTYTERQIAEQEQAARKYALVTAQVWLATAVHRDDNPEFLRVRDSLFAAAGFTRDELDAYLKKHKSQSEFYTPYIRLVNSYVHSLSKPPVDSTQD